MRRRSPIFEVVAYRELLWMLVWRDIRVRYKHSLLGAAWAIIPPLATTLVFVVVFCHALKVPPQSLTGFESVPYPLFALAGILPWTYFASAVSGAVGSLVTNRPLLTKIRFPREVFPFAAVGSALIDFCVAAVAFAVVAGWYAWRGEWSFHFGWPLAFVPLVMMVQTTLLAGISLLLAMGNVFYRDVGFVLRSLLPLLMFVTNVVYDFRGIGPRWRLLVNLNPLTPIITAYRRCLLADQFPDPRTFGYASGAAALTLIVGWLWYHRSEHVFAEIA